MTGRLSGREVVTGKFSGREYSVTGRGKFSGREYSVTGHGDIDARWRCQEGESVIGEPGAFAYKVTQGAYQMKVK